MRKTIGIVCLAMSGALLVALLRLQFVDNVRPPTGTDPKYQIQPAASATDVEKTQPPKTKEELRAEAAAAARQKMLNDAAREQARIQYAQNLQKNLLDQDMDADVDAVGPHHTTLRIRWALATRLFAFKISESLGTYFQDMRDLGFKKFLVSDGYDHAWTWNL